MRQTWISTQRSITCRIVENFCYDLDYTDLRKVYSWPRVHDVSWKVFHTTACLMYCLCLLATKKKKKKKKRCTTCVSMSPTEWERRKHFYVSLFDLLSSSYRGNINHATFFLFKKDFNLHAFSLESYWGGYGSDIYWKMVEYFVLFISRFLGIPKI